jgi:hypothetical protein
MNDKTSYNPSMPLSNNKDQVKVYCIEGFAFGPLSPESTGIEFRAYLYARDPDDSLFQLKQHLSIADPRLTDFSPLCIVENKFELSEDIEKSLHEKDLHIKFTRHC